jgi:hypothetical protein
VAKLELPLGLSAPDDSYTSPGSQQSGPGANGLSRRAWRARHYGSPDNRRHDRDGQDGEGILEQTIAQGLARVLISRRQIERGKLPSDVRAQSQL